MDINAKVPGKKWFGYKNEDGTASTFAMLCHQEYLDEGVAVHVYATGKTFTGDAVEALSFISGELSTLAASAGVSKGAQFTTCAYRGEVRATTTERVFCDIPCLRHYLSKKAIRRSSHG